MRHLARDEAIEKSEALPSEERRSYVAWAPRSWHYSLRSCGASRRCMGEAPMPRMTDTLARNSLAQLRCLSAPLLRQISLPQERCDRFVDDVHHCAEHPEQVQKHRNAEPL